MGYRRDPHSSSDFTFTAGAAVAVPSAVDLSPLVVDVLDQGQLGSCVANASMQAVRMSARRQGAAALTLGSRLFSYYFARAIDHATGEDAGTHPRSLFQAINKLGFPPEALWPYTDDAESFKRLPNFGALSAAYDAHAPTDYRRLVGTGAEKLATLERALADGFPVVFGCLVDASFCSGDFDPEAALQPPTPAAAVGGHCMVFVGYQTQTGKRYRVLNSWSEGWGDGGYCWFSPEAVIQSTDLWAVHHAPLQGEK